LEIKDKNSNEIYYENSNESWVKYERDSKGKLIYVEDSNGFWKKWEYDSQGKEIYWENSYGIIEDNRPKPCENKIVEIEGVKYKLVKV
jgi:hypothetical protein